MGPQLGNSRPGAGGVGRKVERAQRANFAVADDAIVGLHPDDRAVEDRDRFPSRPTVRPLVQGQIDLVGGDPVDSHDRTPLTDPFSRPFGKALGVALSRRS